MVLMWARRGRRAEAKAASQASSGVSGGEEEEGGAPPPGVEGRRGDANSMRASERPSHTWSSSSCRVREWSTWAQMPARASQRALSAVMELTRLL